MKVRKIKKMIKKNFTLLEPVPSFGVGEEVVVNNSGKMYAIEKGTSNVTIVRCPWVK